MSPDEALKQAVYRLVGQLEGDSAAASHAIDAVTEAYKEIRTNGGGELPVYLSMFAKAGRKLVPHCPAILTRRDVLRRQDG